MSFENLRSKLQMKHCTRSKQTRKVVYPQIGFWEDVWYDNVTWDFPFEVLETSMDKWSNWIRMEPYVLKSAIKWVLTLQKYILCFEKICVLEVADTALVFALFSHKLGFFSLYHAIKLGCIFPHLWTQKLDTYRVVQRNMKAIDCAHMKRDTTCTKRHAFG